MLLGISWSWVSTSLASTKCRLLGKSLLWSRDNFPTIFQCLSEVQLRTHWQMPTEISPHMPHIAATSPHHPIATQRASVPLKGPRLIWRKSSKSLISCCNSATSPRKEECCCYGLYKNQKPPQNPFPLPRKHK